MIGILNPTDSAVVMQYAAEACATMTGHHNDLRRPSFILHPRLSIDGDQWCALFGDNLQDGVAGFGDSPELAYFDFDRAWCAKIHDAMPESKP